MQLCFRKTSILIISGTVEVILQLNLVENTNKMGLYDFSISTMLPILILTEASLVTHLLHKDNYLVFKVVVLCREAVMEGKRELVVG